MANKDRVRLLVDALRSGEFRQGRNYLKLGNRYCCLGVACEVAIRNGAEVSTIVDIGMATIFDSSKVAISPNVASWYGFSGSGDCRDPHLKIPPALYEAKVANHQPRPLNPAASTTTAIGLNDTWEFSFPEIADCFEYTYLNDSSE